MRYLWLLFLAYFHLSDAAVCEMSKGKEVWNCYHDYEDSKEKVPIHFHTFTCERCGKEFII